MMLSALDNPEGAAARKGKKTEEKDISQQGVFISPDNALLYFASTFLVNCRGQTIYGIVTDMIN